jgi:aldose sugar dehydrogenase
MYSKPKFKMSSFKFKLLGLFLIGFLSESFATPPKPKANAIFQQYCASCHGQTIEAFVDRNWKHGNTKPEIIKSIMDGYTAASMPSWKAILDEKQIEGLADYMVKSIKNVDTYKFSKVPKTDKFVSGNLKIKIDTVASGLSSPWGLTQLPKGEILVTDRSGELYMIDNQKNKIKISGMPAVKAEGQGGLLDIEIHPKYSENGWIYISYSKINPDNKSEATTALIRGKIRDNAFVETQELFVAKPYTGTQYHYGSRIVFDNNSMLFLSVGERGKHFEYAQKQDNDLGKVHRMFDDGRIPTDNPTFDAGHKTVYSMGHRNPQGLVFNAVTKELWETEHGPRGGDEINLVKPSLNYGWPTISYGINYDGKPMAEATAKEGLQQPVHYYVPSIAPSGLAFVTSDKYPGWKGSLLIGSLRFNYLERVELANNKFVSSHKELLNIGRVRNVKMGSDGYIYMGLEEPGIVVRLMPIK